MSYEVFVMKNCDKCHALVEKMEQEGVDFTKYDLTGGNRQERQEGKKILMNYGRSGIELRKVDNLTDIPVLAVYPNGKPEGDPKEAFDRGDIQIFQGENAIGGLEECLSTR